jgi:hypothetical protein
VLFRSIKDLGLSAMSIFGLFMAVFIGIGLVSKEVEGAASTTCSRNPSAATKSWSASMPVWC